MVEDKQKGFAIASLVTGILSCIIPYISTLLGILAIVFYAKSNRKGMAIAGLVTGIIGLVVSVIIWSVILFALATVGSMF